jgi:class 3 adenylate cyclase
MTIGSQAMANQTTPSDDAPSALERRLATILSADVAGYSRMMGEHEEETVQTLRGHRSVFDALLKQHHGRVFNTAGDAILAEFPSAVEAVRCATEIQSALQTRNEHLPPGQKMLFRMGINVGDVVVQEGDLLGDGVNIAARIQAVAEPGGICISGSVYDQIQNKLSLQFKTLGEQNFKNIGRPVRTFSITHGEGGALPVAPRRLLSTLAPAVAVGAIVVVAVAVGGYWFYRDNEAKRLEHSALTVQLAAEKLAVEEARRAAEEQRRRATEAESKVERERLAAESAKREAALQAKAQSLQEAQRHADVERRQLDEETRRLEAEKLAAAAASKSPAQTAGDTGRAGKARRKRGEEERPVGDGEKRVAASAGTGITATTSIKSQTGSASAHDAAYVGRVCNVPKDPNKTICWPAPLNVENGIATTSWTMRLVGKPAYAHANIAQDGTVKVTLDGWKVNDGTPLIGAMNGHLVDNRIDVAGRWANGAKVEGHWTRSP